MKIKHSAIAGTLESSDLMVTVEEGGKKGNEISITSPVIHQFGEQIRKVVEDALGRLEVEGAKVTVVDKGALDCTIRARVECAVFRACDASEKDIPWGGAVHD